LSPACKLPAIPLFGPNARHSSVPAKITRTVVRRGGQERPRGRRVSASPLTAASTMAALRFLRIVVWFVAILAASMLSSGSAHAERTSPPAHRMSGVSVDPLAAYVTEASRRFGVPERWIRAIMRVESDGKQRARSKKGAMGLMQIMPGTWTELRLRYRLGGDPYDVRDNILAGAAYIRELSDRYGTPGFVAAYNAGPGRYERHLATGRPLPEETQAYVATLAPMINRTRTVQLGAVARSFAWANSSLFGTSTAGFSPKGSSWADMRQNRTSRAPGVVDLSALVPHQATCSHAAPANEVTMIEIALRRGFSKVVACSRVGTGEQGKTDRGWQDKAGFPASGTSFLSVCLHIVLGRSPTFRRDE
jgi:transglycosylase-like protein with SLT domain